MFFRQLRQHRDRGDRDAASRPTRSPASGFERRHNSAQQLSSEEEFVAALTKDIPPAPEQQAAILAANRSGRPLLANL